jgi:hypothetical protein
MAGCAPLQTRTMEPAIENETQADHEALASRYEQEARRAQEKLDGYRKMLGDRTALTAKGFINQLNYLTRKYQKATEESLTLAARHRQQAAVAQQ